MNFVLLNAQHINVSNSVNEETIKFQQENTNMIIFSRENTCNTLLAPKQHKADISSYILYLVWLNLLSKTHKHQKKTDQPISTIGHCLAVKCQYCSKYHKDNSKNCQNTQSH